MKRAIQELIGRRVAAKRSERGLTQQEAAELTGVSRQSLSMIETGTQAPRWETIYSLSEVLRCEVFDLLPTYRQVRRRSGDSE